MEVATKIYAVTNGDKKVRLVEAKTKQQALAHVAKNTLTVELASQATLVDAVRNGVQVEKAGAETTEVDA